MKKIFLVFIFITKLVQAQEEYKKKIDSLETSNRWRIGLAFNTVENNGNGSSSVFKNFFALGREDANNGIPLRFFTEYKINDIIGIEISGSFNKWNANEGKLDGEIITTDFNYFSIDLFSKFYLRESFIKNSLGLKKNWLELYLITGLGYFKINKGGITGNFGLGNNIWFSENLGITFNFVGKWALESNPEKYESNHSQFSSGLIYKL